MTAPTLSWPSTLARLRDEYAAAVKDAPRTATGHGGPCGFAWVSPAVVEALRAHGAELRHVSDDQAFNRKLLLSYRVKRNGKTVLL